MKILPILLSILLVLPTFTNSFGLEPFDNQNPKLDHNRFTELVTIPHEIILTQNLHRYLVFGHGTPDALNDFTTISRIQNGNGFFSISILPEQSVSALNAQGYHVLRDIPLEFYTTADKNAFSSMEQIRKSTGSDLALLHYNYTGNGIKIAIVDTGVDFSNPDIKDSLARDKDNIPIMLDADGQGIILTKDRKSTRLNSSHIPLSRMPSSA